MNRAEGGTRGLFLDRDGTLIEDSGYLSDPAQVRLLPGVKEGLGRFMRAGWRLYLHTNQSGLGRGYYGMEAVDACNRRMLELLGLGMDVFEAVCVAPERPDEPVRYRKPSPRFIEEQVARGGLLKGHCWMVGDRRSDLEAGVNAGIGAVLVRTGKEATPELECWMRQEGIQAVSSFAELVDWLIGE